jgi:hypothetical protein
MSGYTHEGPYNECHGKAEVEETTMKPLKGFPVREPQKLSFSEWMRELHKIAVNEFGFPVGSVCEAAVKPGAVEESEWLSFYNDNMTPREALIYDLRNS